MRNIRADAPAVALVCESLRRVFETHGATPVSPPTLRPKPPPSLAPPPSASKGLLHLLDHRGAVVALPSNLTAPFARCVVPFHVVLFLFMLCCSFLCCVKVSSRFVRVKAGLRLGLGYDIYAQDATNV